MVSSSMNVMFGIFNLGGGEIILILALILIMFGAKKLPELAKGLGQGIKEFKKATKEVTDEVSNAMDETPQRRLPSSPTTIETTSTTSSHVEPSQTVPQTSASGPKA
jgi:sec-independent protein translocase protein TatA